MKKPTLVGVIGATLTPAHVDERGGTCDVLSAIA